jgi:hypothetical protein
MTPQAKTNLLDAISKGLIGLSTFFLVAIYNKVDKISEIVPAQSATIEALRENVERLNNKVFVAEYFNKNEAFALKPKVFSVKDILTAKQ